MKQILSPIPVINEQIEVERDTIRKSIDKSQDRYQGTEADSSIVQCVVVFNDRDGNLVRDLKQHNNSRQGRFISEPYRVKK